MGILCSVSAAYLNVGIPAFLSTVAAICFGCMAFLLPSNKALAYERALSVLEEQILRYKVGDKYALTNVIEAKAFGESIISNKNLIGEIKKTS
jgi:hypothetical protein